MCTLKLQNNLVMFVRGQTSGWHMASGVLISVTKSKLLPDENEFCNLKWTVTTKEVPKHRRMVLKLEFASYLVLLPEINVI